MICNVAYFAFCAVFSVLVFKNNIENSQAPTPLIFLICAVVALLFCSFEMFVRDEQNKAFMPVAKYFIFYGKILLFIVFEAVMVLFQNFLVLILTVTILPTLFIIGIGISYSRYLKSYKDIKLTIIYKIGLYETRKKYVGLTVAYSVFAVLAIVWLVLEIVLGIKFNGTVDVTRVVSSSALIAFNMCCAIVNMVKAIKINKTL
ncbi:MAG: hypothetical protein ACI4VK_00870 [Candidatus Coproplasma sp.]